MQRLYQQGSGVNIHLRGVATLRYQDGKVDKILFYLQGRDEKAMRRRAKEIFPRHRVRLEKIHEPEPLYSF